MNPIQSIFRNLSNEDLRIAILEMTEDDIQGITRSNGFVRKLTEDVVKITNQPYATQLFLTTICLYKEAAIRFCQ
jgi:hypothetical protein